MRSVIFGLIVGLVLAVADIEVGMAAPPQLLNYQGRLTDTGGTPQTGTFSMTFRFFDTEVAGNALPTALPWEETQSVEVVDGAFSVLLGSVIPMPVELFDGPPTDGVGPLRFLEVRVAGETLAPRRRITSAAYALRAGVGNIDLENSLADSGLITKDGVRFIHNFGGDNTFVGVGAGNFTMTGEANTAAGARALAANTTGAGNTATGVEALAANTEGSDNTATGQRALQDNTSGDDNTATGTLALASNTEGSDNTAIGSGALLSNITGDSNTAAGVAALQLNAVGSNNTAMGLLALGNNFSGSDNTATGFRALATNTASANTATGGAGAGGEHHGHR